MQLYYRILSQYSNDMDQLNSAIKDFLLAEAQRIGAVSTPKACTYYNPTRNLHRNYQWFDAGT
ncbi:MAG: hypothetical protein MJA30_31805, partial [Cytophagales bacterium]|nr:hypothetical protein [Cytophagales bacterium]